MDASTLEITAAKFQQIGSVSALLGGLAFAAALSILASGVASSSKSKLNIPAFVTTVFAIASATSQIVATISWTFLSLNLDSTELMTGELQSVLRRWGSQAFILGVFLLFISIGASGWISSKWLGITTSVIGFVGGFFTMYIIFLFVH